MLGHSTAAASLQPGDLPAEAGGHAQPAPGLARHITLLALLLLMPALALGLITSFNLASRLRAGMEASFAAAAGAGALAVADQVETRAVLLEALAASPLIDAGPAAEEDFRQQARRALGGRGPWITLVSTATSDRPPLHTRGEAEGPPPVPAAALAQVMRDGVAVVGRHGEEEAGPRDQLVLAVPVLRDRVVLGALATPVTQTVLLEALARATRPPDAFLMLLDPDGAVVAAHGLAPDAAAWTAPPPLRAALAAAGAATQRAPGGATTLRAPGPGGASVVLFAAPLPLAGWVVVAGQAESRFSAGWTGPALLQWGGGLAMIALGLLLAGQFARRLLAALAAIRAPRPGGLRVAEFEALGATIAAAEGALRQEAARAERAAARTTHLARTAEDDRLLLESVVRSVPEPIFVKDRDLRYVLINDAAARSMGWNERDCIGRTAAEMTRPDVVERFDTQDRAVLAAGRTMEFEDQIVLERGVTRCYRTIKAPWRDSAGRVLGVVGVARDVTRRRAAEERLRAAEAAMRRIARADSLTVMSLGIAHELNQPLTAASNFQRASLRWLDQAASDPGRLAAARSAIEEASAETLRAAAILRQMRDFIDRGQTERTTVELGPLLADTVALFRAARAEEKLPVELDVPEGGHAVMGDRVQLQQVFVNLLRNAIEATEGQMERGLAVSLTAEGGMARVILADRGPGLPEEVTERMFEPFVSTRAEGMGIGLSIARTIIESHGGRITARARAGGGTEFVLDLPLHMALA
ncbi:PAS domain-containing protein [Roseococcus microcysteis]|uniref:PAS domain-containing protein n=1 Tax=Roseococcus microcysteis TaxID=2771361 RepID=UPI00168BC3DD|nr:PAS domain-containing protein [Roseococcus microcysteis]